jgi:hypothetical protein
MYKRLVVSAFGAAAVVGLAFTYWNLQTPARVEAAPLQSQRTTLPGGATFETTMVGHEYRQDDLPSMATGPDGSVWLTWVSFVGDRDDVAIRRYQKGAWGPLLWVPATSGDSWLPQVAVDEGNRVWVVWSQMVGNNWDLYARSFDPAKEEWGAMERLTSDPLPDIYPRLASNGKGQFALAWQGFRGTSSDIFLKTFVNGKWSAETRITNTPANEWEPAVAIDSKGQAWVAYDSYRNGNYDVFVTRAGGGSEMAVASSPSFDAKATVAVDSSDRVWVAWEQGRQGWGKDQGYILRQNPKGSTLGGDRVARIRCLDNGQWREPAKPLQSGFPDNPTYIPHVWPDGKGSIWVVAKQRINGRQLPNGRRGPGYFEYAMTHLDGSQWAASFPLPVARGRSSTRPGGALDAEGGLWVAWDMDSRTQTQFHKPRQHRIHAARIPPASPVSSIAWGTTAPADFPAVEQGHADETADLKAIRGYTVTLAGKPNHIVRGDFHRHTELSWDGGGAADGSLLDFYRYMIDASAMDFGASTDHQGGAWPYWWWFTQKMTDMHHVPGSYAAIFGYERSATYPNGHRNMFFAKRSDSRVTPFFLRSGAQQWFLGKNPMGDEPGVGSGDLVENDTKLLYEEVRSRNAVIISHTSGTRMGTDWRDNDPDLEPVVEIYQGARTNYEQLAAPHVAEPTKDGPHVKQAGYQPQGMVSNAWAKGYKLGIVTSSDHGSTHISYAMVYTADTSRQGILDAIRKRHTYGAMDNIILDVRMGKYFMGDEFAMTTAAPIQVKVKAPRNVAKVTIIKDSQVIYTTEPKTRDVQFSFTDKGDVKSRHFYYVRVEQDNGLLAWSSPFFVNYR